MLSLFELFLAFLLLMYLCSQNEAYLYGLPSALQIRKRTADNVIATIPVLYRGGSSHINNKIDIDGNYESEDDNDGGEEEEEDEEEDDEDNDEDENVPTAAQSFSEMPLVNTAVSLWNKTPPMTQIYIGSSMAITVLSFILNGNKWPDMLHFSWKDILRGQLWRVVSAFLFFGQLDMFYPLTMQFVWQHMTQLEKLNYNKPEEFLWMVLFGAGLLIPLYGVLGISTRFLGHNIATYLVYIWSRVFEGTDVNFMDLFMLKSELLPWFFCVQTLLLEREIPWADLIGIFVGHFYYYLQQKDALVVPDAVKSWFRSERMRAKYETFKNDFE